RHGWADIASPGFRAATERAIAVVYPSSSEACAGAVITCMHAGLVPMVSPPSGIDVAPGYGVVLDEVGVEDIRRAVRALAGRKPAELADMARTSWEFARAHHTREAFARGYRDAIRRILGP